MRTLFLIVLSIALMMLDQRVAAISHLRMALSVTLSPIQYAVSWPLQVIDKMSNVLSSHDELVKENRDLKAQQLLLNAQVQRLLAIESENNKLKGLARTSSQIQGKFLIAELLAVDTDPLVHQVIINKGSYHHVYVGQPVLDANGVMGKVIQVGLSTSRVLLISDPHSGIPVQVTRNGVRAIATGDGYTGKLRLVNVPQTADIKRGDILITSGLGEHFPEGYPVGRVQSVQKDSGLQFASINVDPNADLDRARDVLLVWPQTSTIPETGVIKPHA